MSGRKNILPPFKLIDAQSLADDFESSVVTVVTATHLAISLETAGVTNNTGTFGVQHRIYKDSREYGPWVSLTLSSTPTIGDANMVDMLDLRVPPGQVRVIYTAAGDSVEQVELLTWPALAAADDGDYVVVGDASGARWAVAINKSGSAVEPTGAAWLAVPAANRVLADFSGATTAASMAAVAETAFNGLTGFTAAVVTDDTAADGTMTLTQVEPGPVTAASVHSAADLGAGSITASETTPGAIPNGTVTSWVTGNQEG